ncbi:MAG: TonB-dependent receptor [Ignavibacteriales bacterium]|nr:TonB-dependent receptor [Ignavibacteriales bacterium]MBP9120602.1 TonB-dependent receptor [Ignavibacterium sp.]
MQNTFIKILQVVLLIILSFSQFSNAQQFGKLRGVVTDSSNGEVLVYCNVFINEINTGASTDQRGMFIINGVPANQEFEAIVSYVGYKTKSIKFAVNSNQIKDTTIALQPISLELNPIEKIGERVVEKNVTDLGLEKISIKQLETLPKGVETDVMRSLQYLPGVRSTGDISSRYYVRGGSGDQNLVLLNGVTLYAPFHSLGLFSSIDPEMINSIEFFKGGFSSEYSGRLSSILNVLTKDGNKKRLGGSASISFLTAKGLLEGPIPNGSFIVTTRFSYSDEITKKFLNNETVPIDFYDVSAKLNYSSPKIFNNAKFSLFTFLSSDNIQYSDPAREEYGWKNFLLDFEWIQIYNAPFFSRLGISASNFEGKIVPNGSNLKPLNNEVKDVSITFDLNAVLDSKDEIDLGLMIKILDTQLLTESKTGIESQLSKFAGNISIYAKYKLLRYEMFGLDVGSRLNVTGLNANSAGTFEPRISFTFRPIEKIVLKGSAGIYLQEVTAVSDEDEIISIFDPWIIIPDYLNPAKGISYSGGIEYELSRESSLQIEGYYRNSSDIPVINQEKIFEYEPDLISGTLESYGWEFGFYIHNDIYSVSTSYSLSWVYKTVNNYVYYPKYDSRHSGNILFEYNIGSSWNVSAVWTISSGLPFTQMISYYDKYNIENPFEVVSNNNNYMPYLVLADKNLGRLPAYHRLDLGLTKKFIIGPSVFSIGLNVINAYNRENIFYYERDTGRRVNMLPFLFTATVKVEI